MTDERPKPVYDNAKILEALSKTGFLLEHYVYAKLRDRGHNSFLGFLYLDSDGDTYREMDVVTRDSLNPPGQVSDPSVISFWRSLVIECKNYGAPLVAVGRSREEMRLARIYEEFAANRDLAVEGSAVRTSIAVELQLRRLPSSPENAPFIGSQVVRLEHKGNDFSASTSGLVESLFYPIAKAMKREQRLAGGIDGGDSKGPLGVVLSFPATVTSKPVFEADLTGAKAVVREVPWTTVVRHFHGKAESSALPRSIIVEIVSQDGMDEWLDRRVDPFTAEVLQRFASSQDTWRSGTSRRLFD